MPRVLARPLWFQACLRVRITCSGFEQKTDWDLVLLPRQPNPSEPEIPSVRTIHFSSCPHTTLYFHNHVYKVYCSFATSSDPPDPPTKLKVNLVTKNTVTLSWEPPKNNGGSPVKHYIIERLSWDTSSKEKETWKQCNKRDVEELTFIVEDLKEVSLLPLAFRYSTQQWYFVKTIQWRP